MAELGRREAQRERSEPAKTTREETTKPQNKPGIGSSKWFLILK